MISLGATGEDAAAKITNLDGGDALVAVAILRSDPSTHTRSAYSVEFDEGWSSAQEAWYAHNMWHYYGWDCVTPGQNASSYDNDTLETIWEYSGGFKKKTETNVLKMRKRPFLNDLLPNNVVAGAQLTSKYERVAQIGHCLNDDYLGLYGYDWAAVAAEGSIMSPGQSGSMIVVVPLAWTGKG